MGLFGRALAGIGEGAAAVANKYIDEDLAQQRAQAIADITRTSANQQRADADAFNNDPARVERDRARKVADIQAEGGAKGEVELQNAINTATNKQLTDALAAREAAAAKAKDENTSRDVQPGGQVMRNGVLVYENKRPTNAEVNQAAYAAGEKGNLGKESAKRADHFTDKEWSAAINKVDMSVVAFPDAMGGKGIESPELGQLYREKVAKLRAQGDYDPDTAANMARSTVLELKNKAMARVEAARVEDPKSKLTEMKAVQQIMAEAQAEGAARAAAAAIQRNAPDQSTAETARVTRPIADRAAASAGPADPSLAGMDRFTLQGLIDSPRTSPAKRAAAQAELDRQRAAGMSRTAAAGPAPIGD
jgi:hypothetical protein